MLLKIKELLKIWSESGIRFPFAFDGTTQKPSITLFFAYVTFILAVCSTIYLHFNAESLVATATSIVFWALATIFYLLRRLTKAKIDLDDKEIDLEGDSKDENT